MPKWKPWRCRDCRTTEPPISARGLCQECAVKRMSVFATEISVREGPAYDAWRERMTELMPSKAHRF